MQICDRHCGVPCHLITIAVGRHYSMDHFETQRKLVVLKPKADILCTRSSNAFLRKIVLSYIAFNYISFLRVKFTIAIGNAFAPNKRPTIAWINDYQIPGVWVYNYNYCWSILLYTIAVGRYCVIKINSSPKIIVSSSDYFLPLSQYEITGFICNYA